MSLSTLFHLSADVVCEKLIPRFGVDLANLLPGCIKATILHKLTKRGLVQSLSLFRALLADYTTTIDLSAQENADDTFLSAIAATKMTRLVKIDFNALKGDRSIVTDCGIDQLAKSSSSSRLEVIFLRRCVRLTDTSICFLIEASCTTLKSLCLAGCGLITDITLETVSKCCLKLESIDVSSTQITDRGLLVLAFSPLQISLQEVKITKCKRITSEGVRALMDACKGLQICRFDGCPLIDANDMAVLLGDREHWNHPATGGNTGGLRQVSWTIY